MRILFDIGHPFHVHFFRPAIIRLNKNHEVCVLARDKDVTHNLLNEYGIKYINKGKGGKGILDRIKYTIRSLALLNRTINRFNPDLCLSVASPYLGLMCLLYKKKHVMFNDTEEEFLFEQIVRFCKPELYLPDSFEKKINYPYKSIQSYLELAYLHPEDFTPENHLINKTGKRYALVRFVSESASHDKKNRALDEDFKVSLVERLSQHIQVWLTSEEPLPKSLEIYHLDIPPGKVHDVIANATLVVGGSATMSSEAAILGVPSVLISQNRWGYIKELEEKFGMVHYFQPDTNGKEKSIEKSIQLIKLENPLIWQHKRDEILKSKLNMTNVLLDIIQNVEIKNHQRGFD